MSNRGSGTPGGPARRVAVLFAALVLAACGEQVGSGSPDVDLGGSWHLVAGTDLQGAIDVNGQDVTLEVDGDEVSGTSGCNHYFGNLTVDGDAVDLTGLGGTEMGCDPQVMELEQRYVTALDAVERAERAGSTLSLSAGATSLDFELAEPVEDAPLVGPNWRLESLIEGETVSNVLGDPAVTFTDAGDLRGETGCVPFRGDYEVDGDSVVVTAFHSRSPGAGGCPELVASQHEHVVGVLRNGFTATIEGDRLTLTGDAGLGLDLRAG